jgi:capsular polysaccharide biosynthesis protein
MEIKDHLALIRRRLWIILLVPLLAAGATVGLVLRQPQTFSATATVAVPGVIGGTDSQFSGSTGNKGFVANFVAVVHSRAIADAVAADTKIPSDTILSGTTTVPVGDSSIITVTYKTDHKADAERVVTALASRSLKFIFDPRQANDTAAKAQLAVDTANQGVTAAQAAIDAFIVETKLANPSQDYQIKAQQIASLEEQAVAAAAKADPAAGGIGAAAVAMKPQLVALGALVARFDGLTETKTRALTALDDTKKAQAAIVAPAVAVDPATAVSVGQAVAASMLHDAAQKGAAAFAAAFFLLLMAIFTLESVFRQSSDSIELEEPSPILAKNRVSVI